MLKLSSLIRIEMYKNQLQELAQRSCFNLPSYSCIREGPDHAPRFKSTVNFNGEIFETPHFCTTLRQAEHSAAEVALNSLSSTARPSHSLAARILDETGVYKNLLQEISQRVGASLPLYTTTRSGLGHLPVFTCTVELAGITFIGEPAKNKKQAEKNAAMAAWSFLKQLAREAASSSSEDENNGELEQVTIARALLNYHLKENIAVANSPDQQKPFQRKFPLENPRPAQPTPVSTSRILPLICPRTAPQKRPTSTTANDNPQYPQWLYSEYCGACPQKYPSAGAAGAAPYVPVQHFRETYPGMAPQVTMRTMIPVFSAPPLPARTNQRPILRYPPICIAPPVRIRQAMPAFTAPVVRIERPQRSPVLVVPHPTTRSSVKIDDIQNVIGNDQSDTVPSQGLKVL